MRGLVIRNINRSSRRIFSENSMSSIQYEVPVQQLNLHFGGINTITSPLINTESTSETETNKMTKIFEEILKYNIS